MLFLYLQKWQEITHDRQMMSSVLPPSNIYRIWWEIAKPLDWAGSPRWNGHVTHRQPLIVASTTSGQIAKHVNTLSSIHWFCIGMWHVGWDHDTCLEGGGAGALWRRRWARQSRGWSPVRWNLSLWTDRMTDRHNWKHNFLATSLAGDTNIKLVYLFLNAITKIIKTFDSLTSNRFVRKLTLFLGLPLRFTRFQHPLMKNWIYKKSRLFGNDKFLFLNILELLSLR